MRIALFLLFSLALGAKAAPAQPAKLVSPEVSAERRVTLRLHAPAAEAVKAWGEWILTFKTWEEMVRGDDGTWTVTVGPLAPGIYQYLFILDGIAVLDPNNPARDTHGEYNLLEVPDVRLALYEPRPVPHGEVHLHWYDSPTVGPRNIAVYTPPGYRGNADIQFPVLYLLHGSGGGELDWTTIGRANLMLDNLIAERKARPMIVVMPESDPPENDPGGEQHLLTEIIPFVEERYRVTAGRKSRAIAGQSMGGYFALGIWLAHPETFGGVGIFGAGAHGEKGKLGIEEFASDPSRLANRPDVFWIGIGDKDFLRKDAEQLDSLLSKYGIEHKFLLAEGQGHTWPFWRRCLSEFLPLLFPAKQAAPGAKLAAPGAKLAAPG